MSRFPRLRSCAGRARLVVVGLVLGMLGAFARGDEQGIVREIEAFFRTDRPTERARLARRIAADPDFLREKVSHWLHEADLFPSLRPGRRRMTVSIDAGDSRVVTLRIPAGYDPHRPWPLIYALHGTGGDAESILRYVERVLGDGIDAFVIAAPSGYQQVVIHGATPPSREHPAILAAVRRKVHIDSDRVYATGYSRGGHACWTLAVLDPDAFAGVMPVAGTLILPEREVMFELLAPNLARTCVFACWGAGDVTGPDLTTRSPDGGIAGINHKLCRVAAQRRLPVRWYEVPDKGHGGIVPPADDVRRLLTRRRPPPPVHVRQVFRLPYQGRAAWIEAHHWRGSWWNDRPLALRFRKGENRNDPAVRRAATARALRGVLGELRGDIEGQDIRVYRRKISELTVWIPTGAIDWTRPVTLKVNGRRVFADKLSPDLLVCLTQAARTYDFSRLRWAGLRFKSGSRTRPVTGSTPFPAPAVTPP